MTKSFTKFRSRILFLSSIVIIVWAGLTVRFFHIQVINSNNLSDRSKRQGGTKVELSAVRGSVTDRNNNDLASNVVHYSFGIHPKKIENREKLINAFSKATGRQKNYYIERFDRQDSFVFLRKL